MWPFLTLTEHNIETDFKRMKQIDSHIEYYQSELCTVLSKIQPSLSVGHIANYLGPILLSKKYSKVAF